MTSIELRKRIRSVWNHPDFNKLLLELIAQDPGVYKAHFLESMLEKKEDIGEAEIEQINHLLFEQLFIDNFPECQLSQTKWREAEMEVHMKALNRAKGLLDLWLITLEDYLILLIQKGLSDKSIMERLSRLGGFTSSEEIDRLREESLKMETAE